MATLDLSNSFSAGTTIVAADMNTNFSEIETFVNSSPGLLQNSLVDAKGDILAASADDTIVAVSVGANGTFLVADASATPGVAWAVMAVADNILSNQVFS